MVLGDFTRYVPCRNQMLLIAGGTVGHPPMRSPFPVYWFQFEITVFNYFLLQSADQGKSLMEPERPTPPYRRQVYIPHFYLPASLESTFV